MFVTWMRKERGYPPGYPDRENLNRLLPTLKYAVEVNNFACTRPNTRKAIEEIITPEEVQWLIDAWDYYGKGKSDNLIRLRNKALLAILGEVGVRIGGMGNLQIKNIMFDELGARLTITDKTMVNDPVRIITSTKYLKDWIDVHPLADKPDAPVWMNIHGNRVGLTMTYQAMAKMLKTARDLHNEHAEANGLPLIIRRLHFHSFRYMAQTRDMALGMPVSIQCMQRGWSPTSKQPQRYSRLNMAQRDEWLSKHYSIKPVATEAEA